MSKSSTRAGLSAVIMVGVMTLATQVKDNVIITLFLTVGTFFLAISIAYGRILRNDKYLSPTFLAAAIGSVAAFGDIGWAQHLVVWSAAIAMTLAWILAAADLPRSGHDGTDEV